MFTQEALVQLIQHYGLLILFVLAIFEGPIIAAIAGYFLRQGNFDLVSIMVILLLADLVGDSLLYWIGSRGRDKWVVKYRRKAGLTDERIEKLQDQFERRGPLILILGKVAHAPGMAILLTAGISHMNFVKFLIYNFIGAFPKSLLFVGIGYMLGEAFGKFDDYLWQYTMAIVALVIVGGLGYWLWSRRRKQNNKL